MEVNLRITVNRGGPWRPVVCVGLPPWQPSDPMMPSPLAPIHFSHKALRNLVVIVIGISPLALSCWDVLSSFASGSRKHLE